MPNGKVYDPLIGQWMSPLWENVLDRIDKPTHLHLYRFNGNDPIDVRHTDRPSQPTGKFANIIIIDESIYIDLYSISC